MLMKYLLTKTVLLLFCSISFCNSSRDIFFLTEVATFEPEVATFGSEVATFGSEVATFEPEVATL